MPSATRSPSAIAAGSAARRAPVAAEVEFEDDDDDLASQPTGKRHNSNDLTGEIWDVYVECKNGAKEPLVTAPIDKGLITMRNLISWKEQLGYGVRDYMYYKKRSGNDLATLEVLDYSRDVDAMLKDSAAERKIRLLLAKEKEPERHVQVTPLKRSRGNKSDQEDEDDDTNDIDESI